MRKLRMGMLLVAVLCVGAASIVAPAAATSLPTIWTTVNSKGQGVYKIRPHAIDLAEAAGGTLKLTWKSWTLTSAAGSGTATASGMGTTTVLNVTVKASRVRRATFTRLKVTTTGANGQPDVEKLKLGVNGWMP